MEKPKGIGMRGIDLQKFLMVARHHDVIILVRPRIPGNTFDFQLIM